MNYIIWMAQGWNIRLTKPQFNAVGIILIMLVSMGCGHFDKWTREDKILQCTQLTIHGIDWLQTREIVGNDEFHETNPRLGEDPTEREVDKYMLFSTGLVVSVTHILPQSWRKYWLMFNIGLSSAKVEHNYNVGIRIKL